jgi:hypothetical protein
MMDLSASQLDVVFKRLVKYFSEIESPSIAWGQQERSLTKNWVGPKLKEFSDSLLIPQLVLRFDGSTAVRPLLKHGMTFLPDAHLNLSHQKICAIEVKILRDTDPSGSLAKAIGQTFMYKNLGYAISLGLIFDLRSKANLDLQDDMDQLAWKERRVSFIYFKA